MVALGVPALAFAAFALSACSGATVPTLRVSPATTYSASPTPGRS